MNASQMERAQRHARIIRARFTVRGGVSGDLIVKNISTTGIGASCEGHGLHTGDQIAIDLPVVGVVHGIIRWARSGRCGIETAEPLDTDRIRFRPNGNLLSSPQPFTVAARFQPTTSSYRPGFRKA